MKHGEINIGDLITGSYKFGCIAGVILAKGKKSCVIQVYNDWYGNYTPTDKVQNITTSRIREVLNPSKKL